MSSKVSSLPIKTRSGILVDVDYVIKNNETRVRLQMKAKSFYFLYDRYEPYFYLEGKEADIPHLLKTTAMHRGIKISPARIEAVSRELEGRKHTLLKVYARHPPEVPDLRAAFKDRRAWEYNIPFGRRYMMDKGLSPLTRLTYERQGRRLLKMIKTAPASPKFRTASFDIETYNPVGAPRPMQDACIMISYATGPHAADAHVLTFKDVPGKPFVKNCGDEKGMIESLGPALSAFDCEVLAGYNSTGFDLPYLQARASKTRAKLSLGRDGSSFTIRRRGIRDVAKIKGRIYVDLLPMLRFLSFIGAVKLSAFSLKVAYAELTGHKSAAKEKMDRLDIYKMWDNPAELPELAEYSASDARITWELAQLVLPLELEMAKVTCLPLNDVVGATASVLVESLLMHEAAARGAIVPNKPSDDVAKARLLNPIQGAYVRTPPPGIYENLIVFDFRGLYPSIITSHNIDPFMLNCDCCTKAESFVSPTGARFCKKRRGLIPDVLEKVVQQRGQLKDALKKLSPGSDEYRAMFARQQSLKILANSYYGYLAFSRSRYYSRECAESVTAWGRHYITQTGEMAEKAGYRVLYQDSMPYERPIVVQKPDGEVEIIPIGDFVRRNKANPALGKFQTLSFTGKEVVFRPILKAIEHAYDSSKKGRLMEFITTHGKTVVTPQHSVYRFNPKKRIIELTDAKKLKVGDCLVSMTNPPLPEKHHAGERIDLLDLDFGPYATRMRAYADCERFSPTRKGPCPYCQKTPKHLYTHVNSRHADRKLPLSNAKKTAYGWIGGQNAGAGRIPRVWELTEELAWIMGYYCAEGPASERSTVHNKMMVSFGSQERQTIERVQRYFNAVLGENLAIIEDFDKRIRKKMYYYRVQRLPIVALFMHGFGMRNTSAGKRVPPRILSSTPVLKQAFVDGYMEGDGLKRVQPRYKTLFTALSTKSPQLAIDLQLLLKHLPHSKNAFGKTIAHINWTYRKDKPGIVDLRMCGAKERANEFEHFALARIKEIRHREETNSVFDLEVEGTHNFMDAEGLILVHNTDSCFLLLADKTKEEAITWMKKVNESLPGGMELELEAFYPRGVFVSKKIAGESAARGGGANGGADATGAKKKYALMDEKGRVKIRGFELVRRDWSVIARETQRRVLEAILKDGSKDKAVAIVKEVVDQIRSGKLPIEKFVIETALTKPLDKYAITSPELEAAKKANARGKGEKLAQGSVVRYVITRSGGAGGEMMAHSGAGPKAAAAPKSGASKPAAIGSVHRGAPVKAAKSSKGSVSDKAELLEYANDYDPDYYIDHQIIPTVLKILKELGVSEDDLKLKGKQHGLDSFF